MRIVVTGFAATYPVGGVFWDYMQYAFGFHALGHQVMYLEDSGRWCYDPKKQTFVESGETNARVFAEHLSAVDPEQKIRWHFRDETEMHFGSTWQEAVSFCKSADLFVHLSASCLLREEYREAKRVVLVGSDPLYTQSWLLDRANIEDSGRVRGDVWREYHDVFFTFGENFADRNHPVAEGPFRWIATRQPIMLNLFEPHLRKPQERRQTFTTVASWEPKEPGPTLKGVTYGGKSMEFNRFRHLPSKCTTPFEIAMSGPAPYEELRAMGWTIRDGYEVSYNPWVYRDYLANSLGEWSVAKNAYVASDSGWFSCRSACYLALGVPTIVQDTGFTRFFPSGEGVFAFSTEEEVLDAIEKIKTNPARHAEAALNFAREYFDSDKVLTRLLEDAFRREHGETLAEEK